MNNFDVAPHGFIALAIMAFAVVLLAHVLGFRIVTAVRFGK